MVLKVPWHNALIIIKFSCFSVGIFCLRLFWNSAVQAVFSKIVICSWVAPAVRVNDAQPVLHMWLTCAVRRIHWYCNKSLSSSRATGKLENSPEFLWQEQRKVWEPTGKGLICTYVPRNLVCQYHSSSEIFTHKLTAGYIDPVIWWQCSKWPSQLLAEEACCKAFCYKLSSFRLHDSATKHGRLV